MTEEPNLAYIKDLAGDDIAFEKKFIGILREEFPEEKKEYLKNMEDGKTREAALNVHKLKHKFNILGLEESYKLAVTYEEDLRTENRTLQPEFLSILETIEVYLKTI